MTFEFATAGRIVFGPGRAADVGRLTREWGTRAALLTGLHPNRHPGIRAALEAAGVDVLPVCATLPHAEPDVALVVELARQLREGRVECVVALGGGGVLDAAKAAAALATNPGDPLNYLEVVGRGEPLACAPLPVIALPTTAGTGSEVTRNAVLNVPSHRAKVSLRHPLMLPRIAIIDPLLTHSVPPELTAATGLDALTQCLEPLVCPRANPLSDAVAWDGLSRAARSLRRAVRDGTDAAAREDLAFASLCGGLALANAGLGAVHGLAGPLGGLQSSAPHGALCAALLAPVMAANLQALRERAPESAALPRYQNIARVLTGDPHADAEAGVAWVRNLAADLGIRDLTALGLNPAELPVMIEKAMAASSMRANPIVLTAGELAGVLSDAGLP